MSLRHAILGTVAARPQSGYDLSRTFERSIASIFSANHGQIYEELVRLEERGLLDVGEEGPRRRREYRVTPDGVAEVRRWLLETEPDRTTRDPAVVRLMFLSLLEPAEARAVLDRHEEEARAALVALERQKLEAEEVPAPSRGVPLEWGLRFNRTLLEFVEWSRGEVERRQRRARRAARSDPPARAVRG